MGIIGPFQVFNRSHIIRLVVEVIQDWLSLVAVGRNDFMAYPKSKQVVRCFQLEAV
jgi:ABC-type microcin C transport system permease subunit YejE